MTRTARVEPPGVLSCTFVRLSFLSSGAGVLADGTLGCFDSLSYHAGEDVARR